MPKPLALFSSHYSMGDSLLTLEEVGKTKPGAPVSICDIAKEHSLKEVVLVDTSISGFLEAYKNLAKAGAQLVYGVKLCVCADMCDKSPESLATESNVIVFVRNTQGYHDLIRIWNRAWTEGVYYRGRADWALLKSLWTSNLTIALPFFSSFLARNAMALCSIVPSFPVAANEVWVLREISSDLPFHDMLDKAARDFAAQTGAQLQDAKSIYYANRAAFKAYVTMRAIHERASFDAPRVDHLASDRFSFEDWRALT